MHKPVEVAHKVDNSIVHGGPSDLEKFEEDPLIARQKAAVLETNFGFVPGSGFGETNQTNNRSFYQDGKSYPAVNSAAYHQMKKQREDQSNYQAFQQTTLQVDQQQ